MSHQSEQVPSLAYNNFKTVSRDIQYLRQQAHENLKSHIQEKLPEEYERCLTGVNQAQQIRPINS